MDDFFADLKAIEICAGYGPAVVAGKVLADLGCRVTKVEPLGGDLLRVDPIDEGSSLSLFTLICGAKDSVFIEIGDRGEIGALERLLADADILVLDASAWQTLSSIIGSAPSIIDRYPSLTICVASYFGISGPLASWQGSEEIVQALSGVMSTTGQPGEPPVRIPGAMLTHGAAMCAVISILGDLVAKRRSGRGAFLDCGALLPAAAFLTAAYPVYLLSGEAPTGIGNRHAMSAPWNTFPCSDGWLVICAGNEPSWRRLCETIDRSDLLTDPRFSTADTRVANVDVLEAEIAMWTNSHTVAQAELLIGGNGTPCGAIVSLHEVIECPQFEARSLIRKSGDQAIAGPFFQRNVQSLPNRHERSLPERAARKTLSRLTDVQNHDAGSLGVHRPSPHGEHA
jgi:formyl-CoA transferase/CoA:oxalate CoA-transferase